VSAVRVVDTRWGPDRNRFYIATDSLVDGKDGTSHHHEMIGAQRCPDGEVTVIVETSSASLSRFGCSWGFIRLNRDEVRELAASLLELAAADEVVS
jgi:hypothetical protein